jgi:phage terminase Nu1 subunit (DNA packaging protein)
VIQSARYQECPLPEDNNVAMLSDLLGITPRRIQQLTEEGMPKQQHGKYNVTACTKWYIQYLRGQLAKRQDDAVRDETIHWTRERTRLAREQAETSALKNAELRGELVSVEILKQRLGHVFANIRQNTLSLASKIAPECEGRSTPEIKSVIDREARRLLEGLATFDLGKLPHRSIPDADPKDSDAAPADDGKPVGRRASNPKPRGKRGAGKVEDGKG